MSCEVKRESVETMTAIHQLSDEVTSLQQLSCKLCYQFLWPPIMLGKKGNICGNCYRNSENNKSDEFIPNTAVEEILEKLSIKCPNHQNGCKVRNSYNEMAMHSKQCIYRKFPCPISLVQKCEWQGCMNDHVDHIIQHHPGDIIKAESSSVLLNVNIEEKVIQIKLIMLPGRNFLSVLGIDIPTQKLSVSLFFFNDFKSKLNDYQFLVQLNTSENDSLKITYETNKFDILNVSNYFDDFDYGPKIDIGLLKKFSSDDLYKCTLKIISDVHENKTNHEQLQNLECPVCTNYMRAPIYQCLSGHSVCKDCISKIEKCPTCESDFENTRNYSLETFCNGIYLPCSYHHLGCEQNFLAKDITNHEENCRFKTYTCPFQSFSCNWIGLLTDLSIHLKNAHKDFTFNSHQGKSVINFSKPTKFYKTFCLVSYGEIFRIWYAQDRINLTAFWSVQLVGPKTEHEAYCYEISINKKPPAYKKLTILEMCDPYSNIKNVNWKSKLSKSVLSDFFYNDEFTYSVTIGKIGK